MNVITEIKKVCDQSERKLINNYEESKQKMLQSIAGRVKAGEKVGYDDPQVKRYQNLKPSNLTAMQLAFKEAVHGTK